MTAVLAFALVLLPIVLAVVELIKRTSQVNKQLVPLIAFVVGIFIGLIAWPFSDLEWALRLWAGGLSATGLFELGSKSAEFVKGDD